MSSPSFVTETIASIASGPYSIHKPLVYIASPYTKGDVGVNTRFQCAIWHNLWTDGLVVPLAPLWSHFQHILYPIPYDEWVSYDSEIIPRCDALLRLDSAYGAIGYFQHESSGADGEVQLATALGIPVFYDVPALYEWRRTKWMEQLGGPAQNVESPSR